MFFFQLRVHTTYTAKPFNLAALKLAILHEKLFWRLLFWRMQAAQFQHMSNAN